MAETASERIQVRQVTDVHANWSDHGSGEPGKFSFQLILDDGAEEHLIRPDAPSAKVLLKLLAGSSSVFVDTEKGTLSFHDVVPE